MQQLGANTIRIYNLSPDLNHDECVSIFNAVCILLLDQWARPQPTLLIREIVFKLTGNYRPAST